MNPYPPTPFDEQDLYLTGRQNGQPAGNPALQQAKLIDALVELSSRTNPDETFARTLAARLKTASVDNAIHKPTSIFSPIIAYALLAGALLVALGAGVVWLLRPHIPQPVVVIIQATPTIESIIQPAATPTYALFPTPSQAPSLPVLSELMGSGYGGGGGQTTSVSSYNLVTGLPTGPAQVPAIFRQNSAPLTPEAARRIAAQWQMNAQLYMTPGVAALPADSPDRFYVAIDGMQQLVLDGDRVNFQNLAIFPSYGGHQYPLSGLPPAEQALSLTSQFLSSRGLLDFSYNPDFKSYDYGIVDFYRVIDGIQIDSPAAWVQIDSQGRVGAAFVQYRDLQMIGSYPVLSAEEAWQQLSSGTAGQRAWISISPVVDGNPKYWGRSYTAGQSAQLYGPLQSLLIPVEAGGNPRVVLNNLVLEGDLNGLTQQAQSNQGYFHAWGTVQEINGTRSLLVEGWEPFDEFNGYFNGTVSRQADGNYLLLDDGRLLRLPDLPADVTDGEPLYATGGLSDGKLEWFTLQVHPAGEGQMPSTAMPREARIDNVELVFLPPLESQSPNNTQDPAYRILVPTWHFSGMIGTDQVISIYIQATR
jgi:hypothetical protein